MAEGHLLLHGAEGHLRLAAALLAGASKLWLAVADKSLPRPLPHSLAF